MTLPLADSDSDGSIIDELPAGATIIHGATSASYTPRPETPDNPDTIEDEAYTGDVGVFLIATVAYRDKASPEDNEATQDVDESETLNLGIVIESANAVRAFPDVNSDPVFSSTSMTRNVNENETGNVGEKVEADDADGDVLAYNIIGGPDMGAFEITDENRNNGQITVKDGTDLDYETKNTYEIEVEAEDPFGASDSTMVTIRVMNVNEAPDFMAMDPDDYAENGTDPVATFTATDPEGADIIWTVDGVDKADFDIDGGVLTFRNPPNYEMPTDDFRAAVTEDLTADPPVIGVTGAVVTDNEYLIEIVATETRPEGSTEEAKSTTREITVTVTNVDEPGVITLNRLQTRVGAASPGVTATLVDPDGDNDDNSNPVEAADITWEWSIPKVSRPDLNNDDHWTPAGGTTNAASYVPVAGDVGEYLRVKAEYPDGQGTGDKETYARSAHVVVGELATGVTNNEPGIGTNVRRTFRVAEDAAVGTVVGTVRGSDNDANDILSHELSGDHASLFEIDIASGVITVKAELNHEAFGDTALTDGAHTVTVTVYDPSNASDGTTGSATITITVTDVNEAPNEPTAGADPAEVSMVDENHTVVLPEPNPDSLTVQYLGIYSATDQDEGDTAELELSVGGVDRAEFVLEPLVSGETGRRLRFKESPDREMPTDADGNNKYEISIVARDEDGLTSEKELTITVNNIDEPGEVMLSTIQPTIATAITATVTDKDGGVNNAEWQWYAMDTKPTDTNTDGAITAADLAAGDRIPGATSASYTPRLEIEDDQATTDVDETYPGDLGKFLVATVSYRDGASPTEDVASTTEVDESEARNQHRAMTSENAVRERPTTNNPPVWESGITLTVKESADPGDALDDEVMATDPEMDALRYTVTGGADMGAFVIADPTKGEITVGANTMLDYDAGQRTYEIMVKAEDPFGESATTTITIMVEDVNEPPVLTLEGGMTPPPDVGDITGPSAVSFVEETTGAVATYTSAGATSWDVSGADDSSFTISGGVLRFASPPDYDMAGDANGDNRYQVTVEASDGTTTSTKNVVVTVTNDPSDDTTPGQFDPWSYDTNRNQMIEKSEMITAVNDYLFNNRITKAQMIQVINLYLFGS